MSRSYLRLLGVVADAISSQHPKEEEEWDEKRSMEELGKVDLGKEDEQDDETEQIRSLAQALSVGKNNKIPLRVESLEPTMKTLTFDPTTLNKLWGKK